MKCLEECRIKKKPCSNNSCRLWIDYKDELNCASESISINGSMSLREIAARLGLSFVRIKQIEDVAISKMMKRYKNIFKIRNNDRLP